MLGPEKQILADYVSAGYAKLVYWPMLDLGDNSENAAAGTFCAGEQDPLAFWRYHDMMFEDQFSLYMAGRDHFVEAAVALGLDQAAFESCYDGDDVRTLLQTLDQNRRERGIFNRPTIDIAAATSDGQRIIGSQSYETFAAAIEAQLSE